MDNDERIRKLERIMELCDMTGALRFPFDEIREAAEALRDDLEATERTQ